MWNSAMNKKEKKYFSSTKMGGGKNSSSSWGHLNTFREKEKILLEQRKGKATSLKVKEALIHLILIKR